MNYDISMAPVGADSSKAGDALHIRYVEDGVYKHMVVDGGTKESGEYLVDDIKATGGDDAVIDHMVLTHPDGDHASGLRVVLDQIPVRNLYINPPWSFAAECRHLFANPRWTDDGLKNFLRERYDLSWEVFRRAREQKSKIWYALQGAKIGPFIVLSPSREAMVHLIPQFDHAKDPDEDAIRDAGYWVGTPSIIDQLVNMLLGKAEEAVRKLTKETWDLELLRDGGVTSACNESSVVLYGQFGDRKVLLTGDAGVRALTWAANYAELQGLPLRQFKVVQIPHHGSRSNVGPTILNRIVGPILPEGSNKTMSALCSSPKSGEKHPRLMVLNAFSRRGCTVVVTRGEGASARYGVPLRPNWNVVKGEPFHLEVEDYT